MNLPRLIAVLNLLLSDSDGEALSAARTAARMVKASGKTWAELLNGSLRMIDEVDVASPELDLKDQIAMAFKELGADIVTNDQQLVALLDKFRKNERYLGPSDRAVVFAAVRKKRAGK